MSATSHNTARSNRSSKKDTKKIKDKEEIGRAVSHHSSRSNRSSKKAVKKTTKSKK